MQLRVEPPLEDISDMSTNDGKSWTLDKDWLFKQSSNSDSDGELVVKEWLDVAQFPTNIHLDLMKHNM